MRPTTHAYNGSGQRIASTVGGMVTAYLQDTQPALAHLIAETTNGSTTRYQHGPRGIHAQHTGAWTHPLQDGLGSVRAVVDDTGAMPGTIDYDPYGMPINGSVPTKFTFTGEYTDPSDQLYLRARHYDPSIALFTAKDPFEGMVSRPMSLNGYMYVEGDPVNMTDATGMKAERVDSVCDLPPGAVSPYVYRTMCPQLRYAGSDPLVDAIITGDCPSDVSLLALAGVIARNPGAVIGGSARATKNPYIVLGAIGVVVIGGIIVAVTPTTRRADDEDIVTYQHVGFDSAIADIMKNGIRPVSGGSSTGNDERFYAVTTERGDINNPPPTRSQANEMLSVIAGQLSMRKRQGEVGASDFAEIINIRVPERVVDSLERSRLIVYGPFFPNASAGYTESIFTVGSFNTVNQYRYLWTIGQRLSL